MEANRPEVAQSRTGRRGRVSWLFINGSDKTSARPPRPLELLWVLQVNKTCSKWSFILNTDEMAAEVAPFITITPQELNFSRTSLFGDNHPRFLANFILFLLNYTIRSSFGLVDVFHNSSAPLQAFSPSFCLYAPSSFDVSFSPFSYFIITVVYVH